MRQETAALRDFSPAHDRRAQDFRFVPKTRHLRAQSCAGRPGTDEISVEQGDVGLPAPSADKQQKRILSQQSLVIAAAWASAIAVTFSAAILCASRCARAPPTASRIKRMATTTLASHPTCAART